MSIMHSEFETMTEADVARLDSRYVDLMKTQLEEIGREFDKSMDYLKVQTADNLKKIRCAFETQIGENTKRSLENQRESRQLRKDVVKLQDEMKSIKLGMSEVNKANLSHVRNAQAAKLLRAGCTLKIRDTRCIEQEYKYSEDTPLKNEKMSTEELRKKLMLSFPKVGFIKVFPRKPVSREGGETEYPCRLELGTGQEAGLLRDELIAKYKPPDKYIQEQKEKNPGVKVKSMISVEYGDPDDLTYRRLQLHASAACSLFKEAGGCKHYYMSPVVDEVNNIIPQIKFKMDDNSPVTVRMGSTALGGGWSTIYFKKCQELLMTAAAKQWNEEKRGRIFGLMNSASMAREKTFSTSYNGNEQSLSRTAVISSTSKKRSYNGRTSPSDASPSPASKKAGGGPQVERGAFRNLTSEIENVMEVV